MIRWSFATFLAAQSVRHVVEADLIAASEGPLRRRGHERAADVAKAVSKIGRRLADAEIDAAVRVIESIR